MWTCQDEACWTLNGTDAFLAYTDRANGCWEFFPYGYTGKSYILSDDVRRAMIEAEDIYTR